VTDHYQTITLKLADGREVTYTGRAQIPTDSPPCVVDITVSVSKPLPTGMTWDTMTPPEAI